MSKWKYRNEEPEEGRKIKYVMSLNEVEYGVWENGQIDYREGDWERVIIWCYADEDT